jgi:hypothetical protein
MAVMMAMMMVPMMLLLVMARRGALTAVVAIAAFIVRPARGRRENQCNQDGQELHGFLSKHGVREPLGRGFLSRFLKEFSGSKAQHS